MVRLLDVLTPIILRLYILLCILRGSGVLLFRGIMYTIDISFILLLLFLSSNFSLTLSSSRFVFNRVTQNNLASSQRDISLTHLE